MPQKEEKSEWESQGVDEWLLEDETLSGLREKLAEKTLKESVYSIGFGMRTQKKKAKRKNVNPIMEFDSFRT